MATRRTAVILAVLRRIRGWWLDPQPLQALVLMRLVLGGSLLGAYLVRLPYYSLLYGVDSVAWFPLYRNYVDSYYGPNYGWFVRLVQDAGIQDYVWIAYALLLVASACFCMGFWTRTAGVMALALHQFFSTLNHDDAWGWKLMLSSFAFFVVFSQSGRFFSVDAWLRRRRREPREGPMPWLGPAWPLRLVQINVCTMYAVAGLSRIDNYDWREGRLLMEALTNLVYARFAIDWTPLKPVLRALTYVVFLLEPLAPILLWLRPTRTWVALALIGMHVGLELLTDIGWWNYVMIAALSCFLPTGWLSSGFARLSEK